MAAKAKGKLLDACRAALRIPAFVNDYDEEITDVIEAARAELVAGGVSEAKANDDSDGRVRLAIKVYVKANFGMDNPDAERFMKSFDAMLTSMSGDSAYNGGDAA
nr:MAG TPA: head to tail adaptor [Caudoviricetes sp.]